MALAFALLACLAGQAAAHGHVSGIIAGGMNYQGYDASSKSGAGGIAWTTSASDQGYVDPTAYSSPDIICHKEAEPGKQAAAVKAGDAVSLQWNTWPVSHKGPVMDYLANCNGDCAAVDKTALKFFKIDEAGLIDESIHDGTWATDKLIANNNTWTVKIPTGIAAANYVLRHEILALHAAGQSGGGGGAQNYPQCVNLQISGGGSDKPDGVAGTALYKTTDPGIANSIHNGLSGYTIPGPALIQGGTEGIDGQGASSSGSSGGNSSSSSGGNTGGSSGGSSGGGSSNGSGGSSSTSSGSSSGPSSTTAGLTFGTPAPASSTVSSAPAATTTASSGGGSSGSGSSGSSSSGGGSGGSGDSSGGSSGSSGSSGNSSATTSSSGGGAGSSSGGSSSSGGGSGSNSSGSSSSGSGSSSTPSKITSKDQAVQMVQLVLDYVQNQGGVHARDLFHY